MFFRVIYILSLLALKNYPGDPTFSIDKFPTMVIIYSGEHTRLNHTIRFHKEISESKKSVFMITTSTITTVTTIAALGISAVISMAAVIALTAFLATKELAHAGNSQIALRIARFASVGILPLIMSFIVLVVIKVIELL